MADINPRVDIAFKKIFGVEENKDLLISLINSIVTIEDQVTEVTILNPYNAKSFKADKLSILDIKALGKDGKRFNIEIQIADEADYDKRALYYWAKLYTEQLKTGDDYSSLSKAIGIHILNFTSILESKKYHNIFHITEKETGVVYFKNLELHTIELRKFSHNLTGLDSLIAKVKDKLDQWSAFLTKHFLLNIDHLPEQFKDSSINKALHVLQVMNFNDEEREAYEDRAKWLGIQASALKKKELQGIEIGKEIGRELGLAQGREEGREQGAKQEKLAIAKKLLAKGISLDDIAELTSLSKAEISALEN